MGNDQPSKAKVLIVEDEVLIAEDLENRLKDLGYEVCGKTATGEDALLRTDRDRPDLVIMDLVLRGETDGIEAAEVIRNNWGIPVVFLTAYADAARLERAKLAYPFGYLLKPFQERDLKITLEMALYVDRERRERKKMEEALRESESTYRLLFESSSDALFIHGLREDGFPSRFLDVNDVACERLGYTRKELLTLSPLDIGVEGLGETVRARGKALLEKGRTVFETIHVTKDGRSIPVESSASVFEFKGRQAVLSIARDITERKKSEAAIREGQARLHLALDAAKAGVWEWDPLTKESVWSEQIWDLYALEPHSCEPSYECWRRSIVPEDRNKVELAVREAVRSGCELATEWRVMDPDGTIRWLMSRGRPLADASGRITRHLGVAIDITDRKRADEAVRESEATYRSLFEYMLNGFAYCRMIFENGQPQDYVYLKVNEAFENLTGLNGVTGRNVSDVIPGIREADPSLFEILGRVSLTGRPERFEMFLKSLRMWFQISVYSPKPEHFVAIFDVITDRKRAEQQLKAAYSKLEALWSVSSLADADLKTVSDHILATIGRMTNSEYGFYGLVNEDESVMTIHSWSGEAMRDCAMTHKPREVPIDEAGVWGEAIRRRAPFVLNDFQAAGAARKGLPEGHVPLFNIMVVPGIVHGRISSMAAVANRIGGYTDEELTQITAFLGNIQAITDNKRAEEALRESEKRYRAIFEQASAGMVDCAPDGRFIKVNQRFCDMTGYTADELYRLTFREITHPEDLELDLEYIRKTLAGEIPGFIREKRYIRKDGKIVWVNLSVSLVRDTEGKPANYIVVVHDISDEKRLTQALRRNEEQLRLINDSIQDMIYSYDRGNRFTFANRRLCQVLRMRADQIIGKTYYELGFPEAACREWDEMHRRVHETDSTVQGTISMPGRDGRIYHLDMVLNPLHDDNGAVVGIVGSTRDITDRKDAEDALQKSEDRYRRLTENSPDIILRFDRAGRHLYASPTASQMAPIEPAGFIGRTSRELGFPEALCDFWEANVKTVFETGQPRMEQFDLDGPGGTVVFDWRLVPEIGPEADIESVLSIARDITERKRHETEKENLENQLRHAQKMESVGTLAGGVAHDFNNLLQAINGYTQLLLMNQEKGSLDRPKLKEIEKACERASLL
ncbi:MAG: PAS domain S-box protein, partial [Proteobacteria bacterium]|nr:PAS domain S-box protein [Pseudomonadota bacterium]